MALQQTVMTPFGIECLGAYHRVEFVSIVGKDKINFRVRISKDGILPHFSDEGFVCDYALDGENPIKQAYQYLKTLPEYKNAKDC